MSYNKKEHKLAKKQQTEKMFIKKRLMVAAIILLIVLISCGIFIFVYFSFFTNPSNIISNSDDANDGYSVSQLANQEAAKGNYSAGQKIIDQELDSTIDEKDKASLYVEKSLLALNNQKYDDADTFAKQAEDIAKSKLTSRLIAQIAEADGDKAKAIEYYQVTIDRYTDSEKASDELAPDYFEDMQKIMELQND